jgi:diaminopropionate ammonia-lyase
MGRLECRTPSTIAWPLLTRHAAAFAAVSDAQAVTAVAWLAEFGIETSPTGAAGLAGLMLVAESKTARDALHLGPDASVLIIITEQATEDERKHL